MKLKKKISLYLLLLMLLSGGAGAVWYYFGDVRWVTREELHSALDATASEVNAHTDTRFEAIEVKLDRIESKLDRLLELAAAPSLPDAMAPAGVR